MAFGLEGPNLEPIIANLLVAVQRSNKSRAKFKLANSKAFKAF